MSPKASPKANGMATVWSCAALVFAMGLTVASPVRAKGKVQESAVAGLFYPGDPAVLSATLEGLLAKASAASVPRLRALVCPHAGYPYSGLTAAHAYKLLAGRNFQTVVVMGPSHYAAFSGAAIPDAETYRTPLGAVSISPEARKLGELRPFAVNPPCVVQRPEWWREKPGDPVPAGQDTPFTWEHSVEVQLPFLQKTLPGANLIPVVMGELDPVEAAKVLASRLDAKTLLIASSDLSHFHPYEEAKKLDASCVKAICALDTDQMKRQEACGKLPILTLMHIAKAKGWQAQLLDARNSGDMGTSKNSVVGYAAIAFFEPEPAAKQMLSEGGETYSPRERKYLLELARKTVASVAGGGPLPAVELPLLMAKLKETRACFVTLTKKGDLRGCIGHIFPQEALYKAVLDNASAAALEDPRFPPVRPQEVLKLDIEVSVLTVPTPLSFTSPEDLLKKLHPHEDGVVLKRGFYQATYLPQVWEQLPDKEAFLSSLSEKAGGPKNLWKQPGVEILIYHVEAFKESEK